MSPMPPCEAGAFQMIRTALTRRPYASARSASRVWMTALCPRPSNSTICSAYSNPWSWSVAGSRASTGQSFSRVSGSAGPTRSTGTRMTEVSGSTGNPACSAIQVTDCPTTSGLSFPEPKSSFSSSDFSSGVAMWACSRRNSARAAGRIASSMMTACSEAQIMPLSNALDSTTSFTARATSADASRYAGTFPAPTPSAGLPVE